MADHFALIALIGATLVLGAWREYRADNRRDAALLAGIGALTALGAGGLWLG